MYATKICLKCNKEFYGFHTSKYCSDKCRLIERKVSGQKWLKKQTPKLRYCIECNKVLSKNRNNFCSIDCNKIYNKKKIIENRIKKNTKKCELCGKTFLSIGKRNVYCKSKECQDILIKQMRQREIEKNRKKREIEKLSVKVNCDECNKLFIPKNMNSKYCSIECKKKRNRRYDYEMRKLKYKTNPKHRLEVILRTRFKRAIKNNSKRESVLKLIGCSIDELKKHIENQFDDTMSWKNYGLKTWHIDHIIPCFKFNLENFDEQKKCFHYTNLRPLSAKENLTRSDYDEVY